MLYSCDFILRIVSISGDNNDFLYFLVLLWTAVESLTFDMVTSVRMFTRVRKCTVLASILHPSEETFNLFDRIILLDSGQVMFQGPRQDVLPYFENLG